MKEVSEQKEEEQEKEEEEQVNYTARIFLQLANVDS